VHKPQPGSCCLVDPRGSSSGSALRNEPDRAVGASGDGNLDAQTSPFNLDLETTQLLAQGRDVLVKYSNVLAGSGSLQRCGAAAASGLLLMRKVLLDHALNDLPSLLHSVQQLGLQVDVSASQVSQVVDRAQLSRTIRQKIGFVNDRHGTTTPFRDKLTDSKL
jgi:hypothetical protein